MSSEFRPRPASVLAGMLAAGLMLTVAGCGHLLRSGRMQRPPRRRRAICGHRSSCEAMSVQPPTPAGGCPARFTMISVPGNPGECVRPLGTPVTITSAAVSAVSSFQPRTPSGQVAPGPPSYQIMITLPAADVAAATAVVTTAYDSRGGVDFSVAGRTWALPMVFRPFRSQQLPIALPSKNQALQLHRLLVPSG